MKTKTKTKAFDCVEMMHRGALRIYEETKGMSVEEELAYWRQRSEEARARYPRLCKDGAPRAESE